MDTLTVCFDNDLKLEGEWDVVLKNLNKFDSDEEVRVYFDNDVVLEGRIEEVLTIIKSSETKTKSENWWSNSEYYSASRNEGLKIVDMSTVHIGNAFIHIVRNIVGTRTLSYTDLVDLMEDEEASALISEFAYRMQEDRPVAKSR